MANNLTKTDFYIAFVKNGFLQSKILVYHLSDILNEKMLADDIKPAHIIEWESKEKECTHLSY